MIYQLVYVSKAAKEMAVDELDGLLDQARSSNTARDVTGMLLFHDQSFIQVLEGEQDVVESLYLKIEKDQRHQHANVVLRTTVSERQFQQWSMGYKRTSSIDDVPEGFHHFLVQGYRRQTEADSAAARKALLAFKDGRWRL